jgi:hypothetical protein
VFYRRGMLGNARLMIHAMGQGTALPSVRQSVFRWLRDVVEPRTQGECGFYSIRSIFEALVFWNIQLVEAGVTIPFVHVTFVTLRFHAAQLVHHGRLQQSRCRQRRRVCPPISHSRACPSSIPPTRPPPSATSPLHLRQTTPSSPANKRKGSPACVQARR